MESSYLIQSLRWKRCKRILKKLKSIMDILPVRLLELIITVSSWWS